MHIQRLQAVKQAIIAHGPEHFDISAWFKKPGRIEIYDEFALYQSAAIDITTCGTTACIAGHARLIAGDEIDTADPRARTPISTTFSYTEQIADWLGVEEWVFYADLWPVWAKDRYNRAADWGFQASLDLLDALCSYGSCPVNSNNLPDPTHA